MLDVAGQEELHSELPCSGGVVKSSGCGTNYPSAGKTYDSKSAGGIEAICRRRSVGTLVQAPTWRPFIEGGSAVGGDKGIGRLSSGSRGEGSTSAGSDGGAVALSLEQKPGSAATAVALEPEKKQGNEVTRGTKDITLDFGIVRYVTFVLFAPIFPDKEGSLFGLYACFLLQWY